TCRTSILSFVDSLTTTMYTLSLHDALPIFLDCQNKSVFLLLRHFEGLNQNLREFQEHLSFLLLHRFYPDNLPKYKHLFEKNVLCAYFSSKSDSKLRWQHSRFQIRYVHWQYRGNR